MTSAPAEHPNPTAVSALETDVQAIGGRPAGTTAATLLARRGGRVTLLENAAHPRFDIGGPRFPMNLTILQRPGVLARVAAIGTLKPGAGLPVSGVDADHPGKFRQVEQAVISILAGDAFDNPLVLRRLRVFRALCALTALRLAKAAFAGWLRRRRQVGAAFSGDTLQAQAR